MKILFAGEGGQGVQLAAEILAYSAFLEEKKASIIPNFGVEQRGGVSLAFVKISDCDYPKFEKGDLVAIFCDRAIERVKGYIGKNTQVILGPAVVSDKIPEVSIAAHLRGVKLPAKVWNIIILGKIIEESGVVDKESVRRALEEKLAEKFKEDPKLREINLKALG
ncbi:MAG: 2-oxoacid:acceptor oxidoreductase family protein [Patescibacteria group bacterium]